MKTHSSDTDTLIAALQGDLPSTEDDARMRARLASAGVCVGVSIAGAALKASGVEAVGPMATSVGGAPGALAGAVAGKGAAGVAGVNGGIFSTLTATLPLAGSVGVKTLVVAGAIATGLGYPLWAPQVSAVLHSAVVPSAAVPSAMLPSAVSDGARKSEHGEVHIEAAHGAPQVEVRAKVENVVPTSVATRIVARPVDTPSGVSGTTPRSSSGVPRVVATPNAQSVERSVRATSPKPSVGETQQALVVDPNAASTVAANVLADETLLIERALRAERSGDKVAARNWLSVHQQRFPTGKLTIERNRMLAQLQD